MNYFDCKQLALMIARTYACGYLELRTIGTTWRPRSQDGRQWGERKCLRVLRDLEFIGAVTRHESCTGSVVRTNENGFRFFGLSGLPALLDARAERFFSNHSKLASGPREPGVSVQTPDCAHHPSTT